MKTIVKFKWPITIGIVILTAVLFILAPDLAKQAEKAGSFQLLDSADSQKAAQMLEDAGEADETISLVYDLDQPADQAKKQEISATAKEITSASKIVTDVLDPFESEEMEDQLVSEDQKTVLLPITVDGTEDEIIQLAEKIKKDIVSKEDKVYMTGEAIINNDVNESAQEGLKKTEIITVVLIFALLLIVFRSIVTPFVPLVAVGITYLLSQSFVAFFIDWFGFPVSNYTQIFLVAILFGLGTDYCILLLSRYKEELLAGHEVEEAIINTYKTAGRTLFISALAVFIGFAAIGFADFPIFKSAVAVAVGIAVLMLVLFTVVPLLMSILKDKLFWPAKGAASHKDSKLWIAFSKVSVMRPLLSMLIVAIITIPLLLTYDNDLSFNTVDEIDGSKESVKGLHLISDAFGEGDSLPVQVLLKKDTPIVKEGDITYLEAISRDLEKVEGVKSVRTVTRPTGELLEDLYVDHQIGLMADGLKQANDGIQEIRLGLATVQYNLRDAANQLPSGGAGGSGGLIQAANGIEQINGQLAQISGGLKQGLPAAQAAGGLDALGNELDTISKGIAGAGSQINQSGSQIGQLKGGLKQLGSGVKASKDGLAEVTTGLQEIADMLDDMADTKSVRDTGLFIPKGTLDNEEFTPVIDRYIR